MHTGSSLLTGNDSYDTLIEYVFIFFGANCCCHNIHINSHYITRSLCYQENQCWIHRGDIYDKYFSYGFSLADYSADWHKEAMFENLC